VVIKVCGSSEESLGFSFVTPLPTYKYITVANDYLMSFTKYAFFSALKRGRVSLWSVIHFSI
jgi:hypothetical protein